MPDEPSGFVAAVVCMGLVLLVAFVVVATAWKVLT